MNNEYFTRDYVKLIAHSNKVLGLQNQDISFFIQKYGDQEDTVDYQYILLQNTQKLKHYQENAKYFIGQMQPLMQENYNLKDTIIITQKAIRSNEELTIQLVRRVDSQGRAREGQLSLSNAEQLLGYVKEDILYDQQRIQTLITQNEEQKTFNQELQNLNESIKQNNQLLLKQKDEEIEKQVALMKEREFIYDRNTTVLHIQIDRHCTVNQQHVANIEKLEKQLHNLIQQISQLKQKNQEAHQKIFDNQYLSELEVQEMSKKFQDNIHMLKVELHKQIEDITRKHEQKVNLLQLERLDMEENLAELQGRLNDLMRRSGWQLNSIEEDYKLLCIQHEKMKQNEIATLEKIAEMVIQSKQKDEEYDRTVVQLNNTMEELRKQRSVGLDLMQEYQNKEMNMQEHLRVQTMTKDEQMKKVVSMADAKVLNIQQTNDAAMSELKQRIEGELRTLQEKKTAEIDGLSREIFRLQVQLGDVGSDIKAQQEDHNFKYVTMEVKIQREMMEMLIVHEQQVKQLTMDYQVELERLTVEKEQTSIRFKVRLEEHVELISKKYESQLNHSHQLYLHSQQQVEKYKESIIAQKAEWTVITQQSHEQYSKKAYEVELMETQLKNNMTYYQDGLKNLAQQHKETLSLNLTHVELKWTNVKDNLDRRIMLLQNELNKLSYRFEEQIKQTQSLKSQLEHIQYLKNSAITVAIQTDTEVVVPHGTPVKKNKKIMKIVKKVMNSKDKKSDTQVVAIQDISKSNDISKSFTQYIKQVKKNDDSSDQNSLCLSTHNKIKKSGSQLSSLDSQSDPHPQSVQFNGRPKSQQIRQNRWLQNSNTIVNPYGIPEKVDNKSPVMLMRDQEVQVDLNYVQKPIKQIVHLMDYGNNVQYSLEQVNQYVDHKVNHQVDHQVDLQVNQQVNHQVDQKVDLQLNHLVDLQLNHQVDLQVNHYVDQQVDLQVNHNQQCQDMIIEQQQQEQRSEHPIVGPLDPYFFSIPTIIKTDNEQPQQTQVQQTKELEMLLNQQKKQIDSLIIVNDEVQIQNIELIEQVLQLRTEKNILEQKLYANKNNKEKNIIKEQNNIQDNGFLSKIDRELTTVKKQYQVSEHEISNLIEYQSNRFYPSMHPPAHPPIHPPMHSSMHPMSMVIPKIINITGLHEPTSPERQQDTSKQQKKRIVNKEQPDGPLINKLNRLNKIRSGVSEKVRGPQRGLMMHKWEVDEVYTKIPDHMDQRIGLNSMQRRRGTPYVSPKQSRREKNTNEGDSGLFRIEGQVVKRQENSAGIQDNRKLEKIKQTIYDPALSKIKKPFELPQEYTLIIPI